MRRAACSRQLAGKWIVVIICAPMTVPAFAIAGSGSTASLPIAGKKVTTGLNLQVDTQWLDGNGYRPVTVSISPLGGGAAPADRTLEVTLRPRSLRWDVVMPSVTTSITLEQGQNVAETVIAVPQFQTWGSLQITTYEDGRRCEDLTENVGLSWSGSAEWSEAAPTMLFIDSDTPSGGRGARFPNSAAAMQPKKPERMPDIRPLALLFLPEDARNNMSISGLDPSEDIDDNGLLQLASFLNRIDFVPPQRLPTQWVQLTSVDIIFISWLDLTRLEDRFPEQWQALRTWLSTGTTLCVYDMGESFSRIPELERRLGLNASAPEDADGMPLDFLKREWTAPRAADYASEVQAARGVEWGNQSYLPPQAVRAMRNNSTVRPSKPDRPQPFLLRRVDHGQLVAFADENPFPGKQQEWCWLFNTLSSHDWMWYQRHGMSFHRENPQYWNLLIPGVGDAPVNSFLVLISLFVVVIGPLNYFLLLRRRKLFLLLLTVPAGAGVVTAALFFYALVNDGLGVRVRARSLTRIDQASGRTVSWSRQSYYAGLAPSAGMTFPTDAAVYPIDHRPTGRYGRPKDLGRRIRWDGEQRLADGYLNSRSTSQVIVIESRNTGLGIEVDEDNASGAPQVTNRLGVDIEQLVLCADDGKTLACGKLPSGTSVQLHLVESVEFASAWSKLFAAQRPQYPIGFDPNQVENASAIFGSSYAWWQQVDRGLPDPATATSVLERGLRDIGNSRPAAMRRRSYIAIVARAPDVSLGIEDVAEEASFHVVQGNW